MGKKVQTAQAPGNSVNGTVSSNYGYNNNTNVSSESSNFYKQKTTGINKKQFKKNQNFNNNNF